MKHKCKKFRKEKKESGITLVALVVTIVVLLILAGVSLSLVLRNDGIIGRAKESGTEYAKGKTNDQTDLNSAVDYINQMTGENGGGSGELTGVPIPNGYYYVGGTKDTGFVISDSSEDENKYKEAKAGKVLKDNLVGNQWVWVPVDDVSKYYESSKDGVTISGSTVKTNKYTKLSIEIGTGSNKTTITRGLPSSKDYREPALVADYDSDANAVTAGFASANDMATKMVSEYETMIKSVQKYKGFYIGRYELSGSVENPAEKSGTTLTETTWYNSYKACKKLGENADGSDKEGIATRMIWGCQWDATCDFIATKGETKSIIDSKTWGNYKDSTDNAAVKETKEDGTKENKFGSKQITGYSEYWKANNIYDIAGNCYEWTQEANGTVSRANRGGIYYNNGSSLPASSRNISNYPTSSHNDSIRFSSHFNNYNWHLERENQWKKIQQVNIMQK